MKNEKKTPFLLFLPSFFRESIAFTVSFDSFHDEKR